VWDISNMLGAPWLILPSRRTSEQIENEDWFLHSVQNILYFSPVSKNVNLIIF
jgi:hypothetical protein